MRAKPLKMLIYFEEGFRSFHTINIRSVGQRAAKLPALKVEGLEKSLPLGPSPTQTSWPRFDSNQVQIILKA